MIGTTRRVVPFWVLQATELLALVALADLSLHVTGGGLLVGTGALFAGLALFADGPLGVVKVCSRRLHVVLVAIASVVVALAPVVPAFRPDIEGIIVVEVVAVGLLRLATLTSTAGPRPRSGAGSGPVIDTTADVVTPSPPQPPPAAAGSAARRAGRATAAAAQASAQHRPAAEAQVKRAIRGAGRLAGKAATRTRPPGPPPS